MDAATIKINSVADGVGGNISKLKIITDPSSKNIQVEETFRETMEIISSLKEEVDLLSEQTKVKFE